MNTDHNIHVRDSEDMLPEYDFSGREGVRGKYYRAYRSGYTITIHHADGSTTTKEYAPDEHAIFLDPDVRAYFPDSESVNAALRSLIALIPKKRRRTRTARSNTPSAQ